MTTPSPTPSVIIYTDGACSGNPGPGGWGAILQFSGKEKELLGGDKHTTNNRMELMGAIVALESLTRPCPVVLYTDSQYVQKGIKEWIHGWKKRGWKKHYIFCWYKSIQYCLLVKFPRHEHCNCYHYQPNQRPFPCQPRAYQRP